MTRNDSQLQARWRRWRLKRAIRIVAKHYRLEYHGLPEFSKVMCDANVVTFGLRQDVRVQLSEDAQRIRDDAIKRMLR